MRDSRFPAFCPILIGALLFCLALSGSAVGQSEAPIDLKARMWADFVAPPTKWPGRAPDLAAPVDLAATSKTAPSGDWTRIAFQSYRDGNWEIYLADADGSHPVRLTDDSAADILPCLDAGANRVVYASRRGGSYDIYSVNTDGSERRSVVASVDNDTQPSLISDGRYLAYTRAGDGRSDIYTVNMEGGESTRITWDGYFSFDPAWSPDGTKLAWLRAIDLTATVILANPDGSDARPISPPLRYLQHVTWSPDGKLLAFDYDADGDGWNELAVMAADGSGLRTIYDPGVEWVDAWMGSFTGDGNWLVFSLVQYVVYEGQLYLGRTDLLRTALVNGELLGVSLTGVDMYPDWRSKDNSAPQSSVRVIPEFARTESIANLMLNITGSDDGGSGLVHFDLQAKAVPYGDWETIASSLAPDAQGRASTTFRAGTGQRYQFRSRAVDGAFNVEPWPPKADAQSVIYTLRISGETRDARGVLLPNAVVVPAGALAYEAPFYSMYDRGHFDAFYIGVGPRCLAAQQSGYLPAPDACSDFSFVLPGQPELMGSRGFGAGTEGWAFTGTITPALMFPGHGDMSNVRLGRPYALTNVTQFRGPWGLNGLPVALAVGPDGMTHALDLVTHTYNRQYVDYRYRPAGGSWSNAAVVFDQPANYGIAVAPDNTVHIILGAYAADSLRVYHLQKLPGEAWSDPVPIPQAQHMPDAGMWLFAEAGGRLSLIYQALQEVRHVYVLSRGADGVWGAPQQLSDRGLNGQFVLQAAADGSGRLYVAWPEIIADANGQPASSRIVFVSRDAAGRWSAPREIWRLDGVLAHSSNVGLAIAPGGGVTLGWLTWTYTIPTHHVFAHLGEPDAAWSFYPVFGQYGLSLLLYDAEGHLHAISEGPGVDSESGLGPYHSVSYDHGQTWSPMTALARGTFMTTGGVFNRHEQRFVLSSYNAYVGDINLQDVAGNSIISRTVTIPSDMPAPTLSFLSRMGGSGVGAVDALRLTVNGEEMWRRDTPSDVWTHTWIDLSAWRGQTILLAFSMDGAADRPHSWAELDEISLSAWRTPVAREAEWAMGSLLLTGENLEGGMSVRLDNRSAQPAILAGPGRLRVSFSDPVAPGLYDVTTAAPDGRAGVARHLLKIGEFVFLPMAAQ